MRLNLKENIVFPFSDPSWITKTLIGSACQLLGVTSPIVIGYQLAIIRQTANGEDEKMPEFQEFGSLWVSGFLVMMVLFGLMLIPMTIVGGAAFLGVFSMASMENTGTAVAVAVLGALLLFGLVVIFSFFVPALLLRYAMTQQFSSLIDFKTALADIKQGPGDYTMIVLFPIVASLVLGALSATGVGLLVAIPGGVLMMMIQGRMIGNYYRLYFM